MKCSSSTSIEKINKVSFPPGGSLFTFKTSKLHHFAQFVESRQNQVIKAFDVNIKDLSLHQPARLPDILDEFERGSHLANSDSSAPPCRCHGGCCSGWPLSAGMRAGSCCQGDHTLHRLLNGSARRLQPLIMTPAASACVCVEQREWRGPQWAELFHRPASLPSPPLLGPAHYTLQT